MYPSQNTNTSFWLAFCWLKKNKCPKIGHFQGFETIQARSLLSGNHLQMLNFIAFAVIVLYSLNSFVYVFLFS